MKMGQQQMVHCVRYPVTLYQEEVQLEVTTLQDGPTFQGIGQGLQRYASTNSDNSMPPIALEGPPLRAASDVDSSRRVVKYEPEDGKLDHANAGFESEAYRRFPTVRVRSYRWRSRYLPLCNTSIA